MYPVGYVLDHECDFDNTMWLMLPVEVISDGKVIDRGMILRYSEFIVRLAPDDRPHYKDMNLFRITTMEELKKPLPHDV